ncbi:MAG: zf-HC2 domain-containing protein [Pirellulaceae bacterium]|jgi:anti-sigma factor RsiW|nr:zf-HC2 domain-containing protein [Pirellulaceae bacterium]MCU0981446.1 zf-HC2 domain-containing protein [Pirellulaceae bacterium]
MNCDELLNALNEYVDGAIEPAVCEQFEHHLAGCNPCQIVIDNIRKTITLYKAGELYPLPPGFQQALRQNLRQRWREKFEAASSAR